MVEGLGSSPKCDQTDASQTTGSAVPNLQGHQFFCGGARVRGELGNNFVIDYVLQIAEFLNDERT